jgi:YVTN family beta-propeller protein
MSSVISIAAQLLVVAYAGEHRAALVDPASGEVRALLPTGKAPHEVAVSADGRRAYLANTGGMGDSTTNTLTVIDLHRRAVQSTFDLGSCRNPHDVRVSRSDSVVWVACARLQAVLEVDALTGQIRQTWRTGVDGGWMVVSTPDDAKLYVPHLEGRAVSVIDRRRRTVRTIAMRTGRVGIDVSPDGREVWVADDSTNRIDILESATDSVIATVPSGGDGPTRVKFTPDGRYVLVPHAGSSTLAIIDARTRGIVGSVRLADEPKVMAVSGDGRRAFISSPAADRVTVVDVERRAVVAAIPTGRTPDGLAWAP